MYGAIAGRRNPLKKASSAMGADDAYGVRVDDTVQTFAQDTRRDGGRHQDVEAKVLDRSGVGCSEAEAEQQRQYGEDVAAPVSGKREAEGAPGSSVAPYAEQPDGQHEKGRPQQQHQRSDGLRLRGWRVAADEGGPENKDEGAGDGEHEGLGGVHEGPRHGQYRAACSVVGYCFGAVHLVVAVLELWLSQARSHRARGIINPWGMCAEKTVRTWMGRMFRMRMCCDSPRRCLAGSGLRFLAPLGTTVGR